MKIEIGVVIELEVERDEVRPCNFMLSVVLLLRGLKYIQTLRVTYTFDNFVEAQR